jgi:hypothetical protein
LVIPVQKVSIRQGQGSQQEREAYQSLAKKERGKASVAETWERVKKTILIRVPQEQTGISPDIRNEGRQKMWRRIKKGTYMGKKLRGQWTK